MSDPKTQPKPRRRSKRLVVVWLLISVAWVAAAGWASIAPVRHALALAGKPAALAAPTPMPRSSAHGPIPDAPDSARTKAAKIIGRQTVIVIAPPLLLLWFGWDLWFAAAGFIELHARRRKGD